MRLYNIISIKIRTDHNLEINLQLHYNYYMFDLAAKYFVEECIYMAILIY